MAIKDKSQETRHKNLYFIVQIFLASCFLPLVSVHAETITITGDACANAAVHEPAPGVKYQPGIDADGNQVTPADLSGQGGVMPWPQDINIPLALDLQNSLGITDRLTGADAIIGTVQYKEGKFTFNGQAIGQDAQLAVAAACQQARGESHIMQKPKNILMGE
jgi:hypothetical protein